MENRRSRKWLLSGIELVFIIANLGFAFFMRDTGIVAPLAFAAYLMFFYVATGRLMRGDDQALRLPRARAATKKLLWCLRESAAGYAVSALLSFGPMCFYVEARSRASPPRRPRTSATAYLFVAGNLVTERVFGGMTVKALVFLFYFIVLILMAAPGVAAAIPRLDRPARVDGPARARGRQRAGDAPGRLPLPEHPRERRAEQLKAAPNPGGCTKGYAQAAHTLFSPPRRPFS